MRVLTLILLSRRKNLTLRTILGPLKTKMMIINQMKEQVEQLQALVVQVTDCYEVEEI